MYTGLQHLHHYVFFVAFGLVLFAFVRSLSGWLSKKHFAEGDLKLTLFTLISTHTQFTIGLVLYFFSPIVKTGMQDFGAAMSNASLRFFLVEHPLAMILAILFTTLARSRAKKKSEGKSKYGSLTIFYLLALSCLIAGVPWDRVL
ncbi:MAG: hypothetical protein HC842_04175 [Cytophagales bacterium]|nr:hypothetical protein [Cytophagales bacterium]